MGKKSEKIRKEISKEDIRKTVKNGKTKGRTSKKNLVKNLIIISIIILLIVASYLLIKNRKINVKNENITEYNYFLLDENGKNGVIDKQGNILVNPEYDYIQIPNPSKPLFICLYDYDSTTQEYKSKVLNEKGEELYTKYDNVMAIPNNNVSSESAYQTGILKYKKDGKYGIITISGKKVTNAKFDSIETLDYKEGVLKVKENDKCGVIKINGDVIIKADYDSIYADGYYDEDTQYSKAGYIVDVKTDEGYRYGYINYEGKELLDCKYNSIKRITEITNDNSVFLITYENGQAGMYKNSQNIIKNDYESIEYDDINKIISVEKNSKYGLYDLYGNIILPIQYDDMAFAGKVITASKDGEKLIFDANGNLQKDSVYINVMPTDSSSYYITINKEGNYGIVDNQDMLLVANKYSYIEYAFDKYFIVTQNGKSGVIDNTGNIILDIKYNVVQNINGTNIIQAINSDKSEIYDSSINKVLEISNAHVYIKDNYVKITSDDEVDYLDFDGKSKENKDIFTNNKIFAKNKNGKWGYVDSNGTVVVDYIYDMATDLNEYGFGAIKKDGKWGVVNEDGKVIKAPTYELGETEPTFIGEYYKENSDYEVAVYSNNIEE